MQLVVRGLLIILADRPSWYIGGCVVLWGLTSALTGVRRTVLFGRSPCINFVQITQNFAGILACRVFIGLPEAAFYPGAIYLLSRWYTKKVRHTNLLRAVRSNIVVQMKCRSWLCDPLFFSPGPSCPWHLEL
jgi:MFS family permease